MSEQRPPRTIRLRALPRRGDTAVQWRPDAAERAALCEELGLLGLSKARIEGRLVPENTHDWRLEATLGATAVQPCSVTLDPVKARIDAPVLRRYVADLAPPDEAETEMPEDDSIEPLPATVDLRAVFAEALALALPDFPRAADAELAQTSAIPPGASPIAEDDAKPFAGLSGLLGKDDD